MAFFLLTPVEFLDHKSTAIYSAVFLFMGPYARHRSRTTLTERKVIVNYGLHRCSSNTSNSLDLYICNSPLLWNQSFNRLNIFLSDCVWRPTCLCFIFRPSPSAFELRNQLKTIAPEQADSSKVTKRSKHS
ncbi:hypothetical protein EVAR_86807_1 [Eumeta japonica]|uniref:Uncharacterized protein n=1 Tax=Eumeta variegata TaxID=151549 RepID=A0A4C1VVF8_EUMVA|nr:hypothetical protein EVAR_86807_1 [Eumeta japonica]